MMGSANTAAIVNIKAVRLSVDSRWMV